MCRLAAYTGPDICLRRFLLEPPHGLLEQSWAPRELKYAKLNADGFGFGWINENGDPAAYINPMPIWSDPNLRHLGAALHATTWLANVRSATEGMAINHANTQPFEDGNTLFLHNGFVQDFATDSRFLIEPLLGRTVRGAIMGTTDSEALYAGLRQVMMDRPALSLADQLRELCTRLAGVLGHKTALLNMVVADRGQVIAVRSALNHESPSLYRCSGHPDFPGGHLVASEPFDDRAYWEPVPEHHLLRLGHDAPPVLQAL